MAKTTASTFELVDLFNCSDEELDTTLRSNIATVDEAFIDHMRIVRNADFDNNLSIKSSRDLLKMANLYTRIGERLLSIYGGVDDVTKFGVATFIELVTRRFYLNQLELKARGNKKLPTWNRLGFAATVAQWWIDVVEDAKPSGKPYLVHA